MEQYLSCPQQSSRKQSLLLDDRWKNWKEAFLVELDAADVILDLIIILFIGGVFPLTIDLDLDVFESEIEAFA